MSFKYILTVKRHMEMPVFRGLQTFTKFLLLFGGYHLNELIFKLGLQCPDLMDTLATLIQRVIQGNLPPASAHKEERK